MIDLLKPIKIVTVLILLLILVIKIMESISIISFSLILDFYRNDQNLNNQETFLEAHQCIT